MQNDLYTAVPEFALDLGYVFNESSSIELGFDISNYSQTINFGVSFRW